MRIDLYGAGSGMEGTGFSPYTIRPNNKLGAPS
jgi:hypothetical protein